MIKIGLTGNIGSGKTTVCKIFESLEIPVFYSDKEAKRLYKRDDVKKILSGKFGNTVFDNERNVDFKSLAKIIFSEKNALKFINELIHPLVFNEYTQWLQINKNAPFTIHESAILFENNLQEQFDKTVTVACPEYIRLKRLLERDNVDQSVIKERMRNQLTDKEKEEMADFVIKNDGKTFLIPQVLKLFYEFKKR